MAVTHSGLKKALMGLVFGTGFLGAALVSFMAAFNGVMTISAWLVARTLLNKGPGLQYEIVLLIGIVLGVVPIIGYVLACRELIKGRVRVLVYQATVGAILAAISLGVQSNVYVSCQSVDSGSMSVRGWPIPMVQLSGNCSISNIEILLNMAFWAGVSVIFYQAMLKLRTLGVAAQE